MDYLIVGGGLAGFYTAYKILNHNASAKITLVEAEEDIGGRLLSLAPPKKAALPNGTMIEMGGMRVFENVDVHMIQLMSDLDIQTVEVAYADSKNMALMRNTRTTIAKMVDEGKHLYALRPEERDKDIFGVLSAAVCDAIPKEYPIDQDLPHRLLEDPFYSGDAFWDNVGGKISDDAREYAIGMTGYDLFHWSNLASFVGVRDFGCLNGHGAVQKFVVGGYQSVVKALHHRIKDKIKFHNTTALVGFNPDTMRCDLVDLTNDRKWTVTPTNLVLAIPPPALKDLAVKWDPKVTDALFKSCDHWHGFKLAMYFPQGAWWSNLLGPGTNTGGRCVTDTDARQIWLYSNNPAIILIYCDEQSAQKWSKKLTREYSGGYAPYSNRGVGRELYQKIAKSLDECFGFTTPRPSLVAWKDWPYGTQFWKASPYIPSMAKLALRPFGVGKKIFIVGDSFSRDNQGWGEGAVKVSNDALREMGFSEPDLSNLATGILMPLTRERSN